MIMAETFGVRLRVTEIKLPTWIKRGNMLINRYALDGDDPDHPYNWVKSHIGTDPERFGIKRPPVPHRCGKCGNIELDIIPSPLDPEYN